MFAACRVSMLLALAAGAAMPASDASASAIHPEDASLIAQGDPGEAARFGGFPSQNVTFLSQVSLAQIDPGSNAGNDIWGYVSPTGREIAIIGVESATGFVDVTDPVSPVILDTFSSPTSPWRDIKVLGSTAYVVSEGGGHIQIFDLSDVDNGNVINRGFTNFGGSSASHNIVINEDSGYIYRVGGGSNLGLRAYTVGTNGLPGSTNNPVQSLSQSNLYVHDAQIVTYDSGPYAGREIAFLCSGFGNGESDTALRIYDVTNKSSIVELGTVRYPGRRYAHQGWLSEDRRYFYLNDELDEGQSVNTTTMHIINVEDIENPFYVRGWSNGNTARDHNLYVKGNYIYASNYRSGLRIHDISDPENPVEVAWIDTFPSNNGRGFDGAWSNYPFFPSGNIIISDIQQGLIVVRPELETLGFDFIQPLGETIDPAGGQGVGAIITESGVELDDSTPELYLREPDGTVTTLPGSVNGSLASFTIPAGFRCLDTIEWWVEASSTEGERFGSPSVGGVQTFSATVATDEILVFDDSGESDPGWSVSGNATDGQWSRGIPVNADRGDPAADADGSGRAWLTDNSSANGGNSDVDNGQTVLTSPTIDASNGGTFRFSYWLNDVLTGEIGPEDFLQAEVSTNNGDSWTTILDERTPLNQWRTLSIEIGETIPASSQFRVRFIASETTPGDVLEAGIDAISLRSFECDQQQEPDCPADVNGDGGVTDSDFFAWVTVFTADPRSPQQADQCDVNRDSNCDDSDFFAWVTLFTQGC
ncbi:MAG: choice-of-anchor B family protein [Planctomycetota bacterium]